MNHNNKKIRVLIFIGSFRSGGKERRLIELLTYLKNKKEFEFAIVMTKDEIHYPDFYKLNIPYYVLSKRWAKNDLTIFYQFFKLCLKFKPQIIHTWGRMQSFYALPTVIIQKTVLVNSQITSAPPKSSKWNAHNLIDRINFKFSRNILSNSWAGINSYNPPAYKSKVIYNGINYNRFINLPDIEQVKLKYEIHTPYAILMSASFSLQKDHELFLRIAERITKVRDDITFIGIGGHDNNTKFENLLSKSLQNPRIKFPGRIDDVEALVNACTIGILFSKKSIHGEGISNSIMEYMVLGKPVIANDAGGTREIVYHNENGFLIEDHTEDEIEAMVLDLIDNQTKRELFGARSKKIIEETFSLDKMGKAFEQVYLESLA